MRFLVPVVLKVTSQLPVPLETESRKEQLVSAPVMTTVPDGFGIPAPLTVTLTTTAWPVVDGSGISLVMVVAVVAKPVYTVWLSVSELPA